jgi:hypothetical protein
MPCLHEYFFISCCAAVPLCCCDCALLLHWTLHWMAFCLPTWILRPAPGMAFIKITDLSPYSAYWLRDNDRTTPPPQVRQRRRQQPSDEQCQPAWQQPTALRQLHRPRKQLLWYVDRAALQHHRLTNLCRVGSACLHDHPCLHQQHLA